MPDYRRNRVPGGTFFFTVNLANRRSDLLVREIETLRAAIRAVRLAAPFHIDAWVILPDHMHCIWSLPEDDTDYSDRWRDQEEISESLAECGIETARGFGPRRSGDLAKAFLGTYHS